MENLKSIFNKLFPNRNKHSHSHSHSSADINHSIDQYSKYHIKHHHKHSKSIYNNNDHSDHYEKYDNSSNNDLDLDDIKNSYIIYDPLEREVRVRNKLQALIKLSEIMEDKSPFDPLDSKPKINIIQWIRDGDRKNDTNYGEDDDNGGDDDDGDNGNDGEEDRLIGYKNNSVD